LASACSPRSSGSIAIAMLLRGIEEFVRQLARVS